MDIDQSYDLPFSTEAIYTAWLSPKTVIAPATRLDIHPVVGGHYRLFVETPDSVFKNEGRFLHIDPHTQLRYTWEWNNDGEATEVAVDFSDGSNGSRVRIRHTGFRNAESRDIHSRGWDSYMEGLEQFLDQLCEKSPGE